MLRTSLTAAVLHVVLGGPNTGAAQVAADTAAAYAKKAGALLQHLSNTKDKKVEKFSVNRYNWAGKATLEIAGFDVKVGDVKYQVTTKPGGESSYISLYVKGKGVAEFDVTDSEADGQVDFGEFRKGKAAEKRVLRAKEAVGSEHREFWQAEYQKAVDTLCQHLGVATQ